MIVVAHGNSLRTIAYHLSTMIDKKINYENIPTACPLIYEFDENLKPINHYYLLEEKELKERV